MQIKPRITLALTLAAAVAAWPLAADTTEKHVIALKTGDFELAETDVSNLAIGEAETIVTDSGKTIDIIRTTEGYEIYVDGELLDMPHRSDPDQVVHRREMDIECTAGDGESLECDGDLAFSGHGDADLEGLHEADGAHEIIIEKVNIKCFSDEEESCDDHQVWISESDDISFGDLHEDDLHVQVDDDGDMKYEVIVIRNADEL